MELVPTVPGSLRFEKKEYGTVPDPTYLNLKSSKSLEIRFLPQTNFFIKLHTGINSNYTFLKIGYTVNFLGKICFFIF